MSLTWLNSRDLKLTIVKLELPTLEYLKMRARNLQKN